MPRNLNSNNYLHVLQDYFIDMLDALPLNLRQNMLFMQDGAPPHFSNQVQIYLNTIFHERWIGRGSPFPWPARSLDFNPLDFGI